MHDATSAEYDRSGGVGSSLVEGDRGIDHLDLQRPVRRDVQVRHVASMTFARQDAMVLVVGVEMRPCRLERRRFALADVVDDCPPGDQCLLSAEADVRPPRRRSG